MAIKTSEPNKYFYPALLSIVAIVAIVGLILLFTQKTVGVVSPASTSAELPEEAALVGQAGTQSFCSDSDNPKNAPFESATGKASYFTKGTTTSDKYPNGKEDECKVVSSGKTYLFEGSCDSRNYITVQKNCAELGSGELGSGYECKGGTCVLICTDPKTAVDNCLIDIPDANLKKVILEKFNGKEKVKGEVTSGEAKKMTSLVLQASSISNLKGLEYFTSLQKLSLDSNQINDISPLKELTQLTYLNLGWNKISDVSVLGGLTNLEILNLKNNTLSDIGILKSFTKLQLLSLSGNPKLNYDYIKNGVCSKTGKEMLEKDIVQQFLAKCT